MFEGIGVLDLDVPDLDEPPVDSEYGPWEDWEPIPYEAWREAFVADPTWQWDVMACGDAPAYEAAQRPLGWQTLAILGMTAIADLSDRAQVVALKRLRELNAHVDELCLELTAAIAGPKPADRGEDFGVHEVAVASNCSLYAADREVSLARNLAGRLSATRDAMAAGQITEAQAKAMSAGVAHLPDELAQQIEQRMLRFSHRQDLPTFKARLRKWLARLDPSWKKTADEARLKVRVEHTANEDGTGQLWVHGPLEQTAALDLALNAYASATKEARDGTTDERKLAGLVEWAERYLTSPDAPRRHGRAISLSLCVDPAGLFALADHPAEVIGYGMVPAEAAARLLAEGSPIRRLIIDERDGRLLDYGTKTYVVPPALAEHLIALHVTGAGPHSSVPASLCDLDHLQPYGEGGATSDENVTPQDRRWHRAKTHAGWTYVRNKDGTVDWTSPSGQTQRVDPHDYRLGP